MSLHDRFYILHECFHHYSVALQYEEAVAIRQEELKLGELLEKERKWLTDDRAAHTGYYISSDEESVPVTANAILGRRMQAQLKSTREMLDSHREALEDPHALPGEQRLAWYNGYVAMGGVPDPDWLDPELLKRKIRIRQEEERI